MKNFVAGFVLATSVFMPAHVHAMDLMTQSTILASDCDGEQVQIMILITEPGIAHIGFPKDICKNLQEYRKEQEQNFKEKTVPPALPQEEEDSGWGEWNKV